MNHEIIQEQGKNIYSSKATFQAKLNPDQVLDKLTNILGASNLQADPDKNEHYRVGWRSGEKRISGTIPTDSIRYLA